MHYGLVAVIYMNSQRFCFCDPPPVEIELTEKVFDHKVNHFCWDLLLQLPDVCICNWAKFSTFNYSKDMTQLGMAENDKHCLTGRLRTKWKNRYGEKKKHCLRLRSRSTLKPSVCYTQSSTLRGDWWHSEDDTRSKKTWHHYCVKLIWKEAKS